MKGKEHDQRSMCCCQVLHVNKENPRKRVRKEKGKKKKNMFEEIMTENFIILMTIIYPKKFSRDGEVAQWIEMLAIKTDDLSLVPGT